MKVKGHAASIGIAIGPVHLWETPEIDIKRLRLTRDEVVVEQKRLRLAVEQCAAAFGETRDQMRQDYGQACAAMMEAYILMLQDPAFESAVHDLIAAESANAPWAIRQVIDTLEAPLLESPSPYFRERASDIEHVGRRLIEQLDGDQPNQATPLPGCIVLADDMSPSYAARLLTANIAGLALRQRRRSKCPIDTKIREQQGDLWLEQGLRN